MTTTDGTFSDEDEPGGEPFNYGAPDSDDIEVDVDSADEPIVAVYRYDTLSGTARDLARRVQARLRDGDAHPLTVYVKVGADLHRATYTSEVTDDTVIIGILPPRSAIVYHGGRHVAGVLPISARFPLPGGLQ